MKLLFDQNLSFKLCEQLSDLFPQSSQVKLVGLGEADDRAIWEHAKAHGFTLVSLDADFAEMAACSARLPKSFGCAAAISRQTMVEKLLRDHAEAIAAFEGDDAVCLEIY